MQTQAERKEVKKIDRIKRLDCNNNTPDLRTLVKKTPELAEETSQRGKTWHNLDQGTPYQTEGLVRS